MIEAKADAALVERLVQSQVFIDYERAFGLAMGLPLSFRAMDDPRLAHFGHRHESPFCHLLGSRSETCAACQRAQQQQLRGLPEKAHTETCFAGLQETVVPVRLGQRIIGYLRTGEVFLEKPHALDFEPIAAWLRHWGMGERVEEFRAAYFQTRVMAPKPYDSAVRMLQIFADHLGIVANRISLQITLAAPPAMDRARQYIDEHQTDPLSLQEVAGAVNMSRFYFCKKFRKTFGCTFTEYLTRRRIEAAKPLLLKPKARVAEVALRAGFRSVSHFNRAFRQVVGLAPMQFRQRGDQ